jgi:hypothetical protein
MAQNFNVTEFLAKEKGKSTAFDANAFLVSQGIKKPDLSTPEGMELAIRAAGLNPPAQTTPLSALKRTAGILNVGTAATSGFTKGLLTGKNPLTTAKESITGSLSGKDITGFSDTYRDAFTAPTSRLGKVGVATGGFIADVAFDPLTYLTFGLGKGLQVGANTLSRGGTRLFEDVSTQAVSRFGQKGTREAELLFSEALGKKGITEESMQKLIAKGWDEQTIKTVAEEAPRMIDKGGIKFAGNTLISTDAIANSPIGRVLKVVSETEAIKNLREAIGKTFVPDFMKNPKITKIIERGGREIQNAFEGILAANQKLFKGLSEEQMARLFTSIWDKKKMVANSGELVEGVAKTMDEAAWLKKGIQNPYDEAGGLTAKARQALEGDAKKESKRLLQSEKIVFEDDEALQKVSDELFEPKNIEKKLPDGSISTEVQPSIMARYAKLAGIPEEDAIKFYIPSKFEEFLNKKGGVSPSGVSSPKMNYKKEFTGVEREDQITDPFELFTRGQIEVVTDRIKTDMARAVVRELGIPLNQLSEDMAKKLGYVKFERKALSSAKEAVERSKAIETLKDIKVSMRKLTNELKGTANLDKETSRTIEEISNKIDSLDERTAKKLSAFFSEGKPFKKETAEKLRVKTIPPTLQKFEKEIKDAGDGYKPSVQLELAYENGDLERAGFKTIGDFVDNVKSPVSKTQAKEVIVNSEVEENLFKVDNFSEKQKTDLISSPANRRDTNIIEEKLRKEIVEMQDLPLRSRILQTSKVLPVSTVVQKELSLLKERLKNFNRGYKEGVKNVKDTQKYLQTIIRDNFPIAERGRFTNLIVNSNNKAKLDNAITQIEEKFQAFITKQEDIAASKKLDVINDLQKQVTRLKEKLENVSEIKKPSVQDALDNLVRQIEDMTITKTNIRESGIVNAPKITGWIPKEVNDEISKFYEPKMNAIDDLAKSIGFDYATGLFKGYVTSLFPSFHVRNITSNVFQNMLKIGVDAANPILHGDAIDIVLGRNLDKQITTKTGKVISLRHIRDMINRDSDILNSGAFGKMENFIEESRDIAMKGPGLNRFNPLSRDNVALQAGRKFGTAAEQEAKLVNILSNIMQGKSVQEGIKSADEALFNYSKLTEFERSVMRRIIPFYTFARKNAELQVKALARTPGIVAAELKGIKAIGEAVGEPVTEEDIKGLPGYVLNSLGIKAGVNEYGQNTFITGFGLPIEEFLGRFSGDKGIISNVVSNLMTQMNPTIKYPAELATERDFFRGRPIAEINNAGDLKPFLDALPKPVADEFKKVLEYREIPGQAVYVNGVKTGTQSKYVANPFALHFMRNLFTARIQSTVGFLSSEDETNWNKALKFFTGVKGWSIDQEQQKFYKDMERSQELQEFIIRMGLAKKFESLYTPKKKPFEDVIIAN